MSFDQIFTIAYLSIGALIGVLSIPYNTEKSALLWVLMSTTIWPAMVLAAILVGLINYRDAWRSYSEKKMMEKYSMQESAGIPDEFMDANRRLRDSYIKRK
ncbi:MAG: hypothetical protein PHW66_06310 [Gallionella sp.]|nr:hypothetical protein [Gallionella sp.]